MYYYYYYIIVAFIYLTIKDILVYLYSRNDCILGIYYEQNMYDFMHAIKSFIVTMPTKIVIWMTAKNEIYNNYY